MIGLSGGVDSSLVAAIAVDALGAENVVGVAMPSRYSSQGSLTDAKALADNLGIALPRDFDRGTLPGLSSRSSPPKPRAARPITFENLQARIRGNILMALSNAYGWLVLTTGNKSEMSTGYCTLYGDMAGGFAVIPDVPKTLVYEAGRSTATAHGRARRSRSRFSTSRPPRELKPDQKDTDSLPPYEHLDPILRAYVEEDFPVADIVSAGNPGRSWRGWCGSVDPNEYKRRQSPPGVRITSRALAATGACPSRIASAGGPLQPQSEREAE